MKTILSLAVLASFFTPFFAQAAFLYHDDEANTYTAFSLTPDAENHDQLTIWNCDSAPQAKVLSECHDPQPVFQIDQLKAYLETVIMIKVKAENHSLAPLKAEDVPYFYEHYLARTDPQLTALHQKIEEQKAYLEKITQLRKTLPSSELYQTKESQTQGEINHLFLEIQMALDVNHRADRVDTIINGQVTLLHDYLLTEKVSNGEVVLSHTFEKAEIGGTFLQSVLSELAFFIGKGHLLYDGRDLHSFCICNAYDYASEFNSTGRHIIYMYSEDLQILLGSYDSNLLVFRLLSYGGSVDLHRPTDAQNANGVNIAYYEKIVKLISFTVNGHFGTLVGEKKNHSQWQVVIDLDHPEALSYAYHWKKIAPASP